MSICPLTGQQINLVQPNPSGSEFFYETTKTGKVKITDIALMSAPNLSVEEKIILTGICRNHTIKNDDAFRVTLALL